ncbi:MAG: hypothetical protein AAF411_18810, partial [Myxococcota bacterium]
LLLLLLQWFGHVLLTLLLLLRYKNVYSMYMQNLQGAGNLYGTVGDLYRWDQFLHGGQLLSNKSVEKMVRPYTDVNQQWIPGCRRRVGAERRRPRH